MTADTEAMEAARRIKSGDIKITDALKVARALLQQRESIIEECAKVADEASERYFNAGGWGEVKNHAAEEIARGIRALAAGERR